MRAGPAESSAELFGMRESGVMTGGARFGNAGADWEPGRGHDTAVLVDFENMAGLGGERQVCGVVDSIRAASNVSVVRAFADWGRFAGSKRALSERGVELVEIPSNRARGKNAADIRMTCDAMELALTRPWLRTFVLVSGDSDFTPLFGRLREFGKLVVVFARRRRASSLLSGWCDELVLLDDPDEGQRPVEAPGRDSAHVVPKPTPLRSRCAEVEAEETRVVPAGASDRSDAPSLSASVAKGETRRDPAADHSDRREQAVTDLLWVLHAAAACGLGAVRLSTIASTLRVLDPDFSIAACGIPKSQGFKALPRLAASRGLVEIEEDRGANDYVVRATEAGRMSGATPARLPMVLTLFPLLEAGLPCSGRQVERLLAARASAHRPTEEGGLREALGRPGGSPEALDATMTLLRAAGWFSPPAEDASDDALMRVLAVACAERTGADDATGTTVDRVLALWRATRASS